MNSTKNLTIKAITLIDLTTLNDDDKIATIIELCKAAKTNFGNTAAVCIYPQFIPYARKQLLLQNTPDIKIVTVANFPHGGSDINIAVTETKASIAYGADEIDVVFPYRAFLDGDEEIGYELVKQCKNVIQEHNIAYSTKIILKVILETGELKSEDNIRKASQIAIKAGADFIKTSTGKVAINATLSSSKVMLQVIKDMDKIGVVGFKPAGG